MEGGKEGGFSNTCYIQFLYIIAKTASTPAYCDSKFIYFFLLALNVKY